MNYRSPLLFPRSVFNTVRQVYPNQSITTIIGRPTGAFGYAGDGGTPLKAVFYALAHAVPDGAGGFWLSDAANAMLRYAVSL